MNGSKCELRLHATHSNWRLFTIRKKDTNFLDFESNVFQRDGYQCQFCGFIARKHMEVINKDGNFYNNKIDNLVTVCCLCTQCFFLESVGHGEYGGGVLIVLPEMTQIELIASCHVMFHSILSEGRASHHSRGVYRSLRLRAQQAEKILGKGMSSPSLLGRLLVDCNDKQRDIIQYKIQSCIKLLPDLQLFAEIIKEWAKEGLDELQRVIE